MKKYAASLDPDTCSNDLPVLQDPVVVFHPTFGNSYVFQVAQVIISSVIRIESQSMMGSVRAQCTENHTFQNQELQTIRVPVGGIATGNLLVDGRGNIAYVEVFNRPDRQRKLEKTCFSFWVKEEGNTPRVTYFPELQWQFMDERIRASLGHQDLLFFNLITFP